MKYLAIILTIGLIGCGANISAQDAKPNDDGNQPKKAAAPKEKRPPAGTIIEKWPTKKLGFSQAKAQAAFAELFFAADWEEFDPTRRKYLRPVQPSDLRSREPKTNDEKSAASIAYLGAMTGLPVGYQIAVDIPKEVPAAWKLSAFKGIHWGRPALDPATQQWAYKKGEAKDATVVWATFLYTDSIGRESRNELVLLKREANQGKPGAFSPWRVEFTSWGTMTSEEYFGGHGVWMMLEHLSPEEKEERYACALYANALFRDHLLPWWDIGFNYETSYYADDTAKALAPWALSAWLDEDADDVEAMTYFFCYVTGVGLPKENLVKHEESFLTPKMSEARKKLSSSKDYAGHLKRRSLSAFKLSKRKSDYRRRYIAALKKKKQPKPARKWPKSIKVGRVR